MQELNKLQDLQDIISEKPAVLVYFYNDNCAPCKSLRPKVVELLNDEFPLMQLVFINSEFREIPAFYGVYDNPTILVFFDRKEYIRESKYVATSKLQIGIERYYKLIFEE